MRLSCATTVHTKALSTEGERKRFGCGVAQHKSSLAMLVERRIEGRQRMSSGCVATNSMGTVRGLASQTCGSYSLLSTALKSRHVVCVISYRWVSTGRCGRDKLPAQQVVVDVILGPGAWYSR